MMLLLALTLIAAALPAAASAHAGNPNYRSEITSVDPEISGLGLQVVNYDDNLELRNDTGEDVLVRGYSDEPYARIAADGTVEVNQNSPAAYLNEERDGTTPVPDSADSDAAPDWKTLDTTGRFAWHDHRIHYMGEGLPPQVKDPDVPVTVFDWKVPLEVGGKPVEVAGTLRWVPLPGGGPPAAALVGLAAILLASLAIVVVVRRRRRAGGPRPVEEAW
jgi:hypothetical protein